MGYLVGFALLLLIQGHYCFGCAVNADQRPLLIALRNTMIRSVTPPAALPNPSALLALRLLQDHVPHVEQKLLKKLIKDAISTGQNYPSGLAALHALAHNASCSDPRNVSAGGHVLNLVNLLERKYEEELENIRQYDYPLTTYYQVSLSILALCQVKGKFSACRAADTLSPGEEKYELGGKFSVDTAAVAVLAQICMQSGTLPPKVNKTLTASIQWLVQKILKQKLNDGIIGNMYSTGLAMQALVAADSYLTPGSWDCPQTLNRVLEEIPKGTFDNPMAASQLLPSLEGITYLNGSTVNCTEDPGDHSKETFNFVTPKITSSTTKHRPQRLIRVSYTITDSVTRTFSYSIILYVPKGSVFFSVMQVAQKVQPDTFSFTYEQTTWGPYITSINGLRADNKERTYWQLLSGETPLDTGAGNYVVSDGESLVAKFTTY